LNRWTDVGFRRKNTGALLGRYFVDMREVLDRLSRVVRHGAPVFFVVGDNHTYAGGQRTEIKTAQLLGELAESLGAYVLEDSIPMEMLVSRDIFKRNATASETILCLRKT
jgi:site-specific DNA-methyltransferase (cytosine-N4-specific)